MRCDGRDVKSTARHWCKSSEHKCLYDAELNAAPSLLVIFGLLRRQHDTSLRKTALTETPTRVAATMNKVSRLQFLAR